MEKFIAEIKKGNIYCIDAKQFDDESQYCIEVVSKFASQNNTVLYMSHKMDEDEFDERQKSTGINASNNVEFIEMYILTIPGLEMFTDEVDYDLIVLDPYDFYSGKLSIDELEEFAKENNLAILITTNNEQLISKR